MTVTRLRERILARLTKTHLDEDRDGNPCQFEVPPDPDTVDDMVELFEQMMAEVKAGNGS